MSSVFTGKACASQGSNVMGLSGLNKILSVTSHITCIAARCLINMVYLMAVPLSGNDDIALFE